MEEAGTEGRRPLTAETKEAISWVGDGAEKPREATESRETEWEKLETPGTWKKGERGMTVGWCRDSRNERRLLTERSGGQEKSSTVKLDLNRGQRGRNRVVEERLQRSLFGRGKFFESINVNQRSFDYSAGGRMMQRGAWFVGSEAGAWFVEENWQTIA